MYYSSPKPLFHLGKFPIGATEFIILLQIVGLLVVAFTQGAVLPHVAFSVEGLFSGKIWQVITYPFFNQVGFFFFLGLYFFYQFGRMVEAQLGRTTFLSICLIAILTVPLIFTLYALTGGASSVFFGSQVLSLCVFSCFCVMYPNLPTMLLQLPIKWMGLFFLAASLLGALQAGAFDQLIAIIVAVSFSLIIVQSKGKAIIKLFPDSIPERLNKRQKSKVTRMPRKHTKKAKKAKVVRSSKIKPRVKIKSETEVDAILDKISEHGLHSLTDEERQTLQNARQS